MSLSLCVDADDSCSKWLGRVEAKHDRIEAGQETDKGHQTAQDNLASAVRKEMGWTKKERKEGQQK